MRKKLIALFLTLTILCTLCACGGGSGSAFRTLSAVGTKNYAMICRGGDKLAPVLNAALSAIAGSGTLSAITLQWLGTDRSCLEGDINALTTITEMPEPRTLIVGVETDFYPISYQEGDEARGLCVDLANAIGTALGWEVRLQHITPDEVGTQLASGNIDVALGFDRGLVKASDYTISDTFMQSDILVAVPAGSEIRSLRELNGQRIGTVNDPAVLKAINADEKLTKYSSGATRYLTLPRCMDALEHGWCAAIALDALMLYYYRGA